MKRLALLVAAATVSTLLFSVPAAWADTGPAVSASVTFPNSVQMTVTAGSDDIAYLDIFTYQSAAHNTCSWYFADATPAVAWYLNTSATTTENYSSPTGNFDVCADDDDSPVNYSNAASFTVTSTTTSTTPPSSTTTTVAASGTSGTSGTSGGTYNYDPSQAASAMDSASLEAVEALLGAGAALGAVGVTSYGLSLVIGVFRSRKPHIG